MSVRSRLGEARDQILSIFYRREVPFTSLEPVVSFSFDDFPRSAYAVGGSILERFGVRGTYYTAANLMNTTNELGEQFCPDDLHGLLGKGHELANHTFSHVSCRSLSCSAFREEVEKGWKALAELAGVNASNFSYPYGHATLRSKKILGPGLTTSSRSTIPGFNGPEVDLNLLRANRLYGDVEMFDHVKKLLQQNAQQKSWLIFYTHDVRPNPSEYGCTPALFEFAVSQARALGNRILTVQKVLGELGVKVSG